MTDQKLLSEPANGDDSTITANDHLARDHQPEAAERVEMALQPTTASMNSLLANSVEASGAGRLAREMAEQNGHLMAKVIGVDSTSAALADVVFPRNEAADLLLAAAQPALDQTRLLGESLVPSGLGQWAAEMAEQHRQSQLATVLSALPDFQRPFAEASQRLQDALLPGLTATSVLTDLVPDNSSVLGGVADLQAAVQPALDQARLLGESLVPSGLGQWAAEMAEQHHQAQLTTVLSALPKPQWPFAAASQRLQDALLPGLTATSALTDSVTASGVGLWAAEMAEQNVQSQLANLIGFDPSSIALTDYSSVLGGVADLQAAVQPALDQARLLGESLVPSGLGQWAAEMAEQHRQSQLTTVFGGLPDLQWPLVGVTRWMQDARLSVQPDWEVLLRQVADAPGLKPLFSEEESGLLREIWRKLARGLGVFRDQLFAALLAAREAAIRGDKSAVAAFFAEWSAPLPRSRPSARMEAAMDALLEARLDDPERAFETLDEIRLDATRRFRRGRRFLGETQIGGRRIVPLDGEPWLLDQMSSIRCPGGSVEERALLRLDGGVSDQVNDQRLAKLLTGMTMQEQQVIWAYGFLGETWEGAAARFGLPPSEGERIRAKAQRRAEASVKNALSGPILLGR